MAHGVVPAAGSRSVIQGHSGRFCSSTLSRNQGVILLILETDLQDCCPDCSARQCSQKVRGTIFSQYFAEHPQNGITSQWKVTENDLRTKASAQHLYRTEPQGRGKRSCPRVQQTWGAMTPASCCNRANFNQRLFRRYCVELEYTSAHSAPWRVSLYKDRQSNRRVGVFQIRSRNSRWTEVHQFLASGRGMSVD